MRRSAVAGVLLSATLLASALAIILAPIVVLVALVRRAAPALSADLLLEGPSRGLAEGGLLPWLLGSVCAVVVGLLPALPLGGLLGLFLAERRDLVEARLLRTLLTAALAVPPLVTGLAAALLVAGHHGTGPSLAAVACALAFTALPGLALHVEEAIRAVPRDVVLGAAALGASRARILRTIVWPHARRAFASGTLRAAARLTGAAAPTLFAGAAVYATDAPTSLLDPVATLPARLLAGAGATEPGAFARTAAAALGIAGTVIALEVSAALLRRPRTLEEAPL